MEGIKRRLPSRNTLSSSSSAPDTPNDDRKLCRSVTIEDFLSKWNLDIETGSIEQGAAASAADADNGSRSQQHKCCGHFECLETVHQDGGDFSKRVAAAIRPAMGSFIFFSALIFTRPRYLGAIWIGTFLPPLAVVTGSYL
eukprot:scaffold1400_cov137-Cylindrotheca_fusiformis.AAC.12